MNQRPVYIYLLHFMEPIAHAQHYTGSTRDLQRRFEEHHRGEGAKITRAFAEAGIGFKVARVWETTSREAEQEIKAQKNGRQYCRICWSRNARSNRNGMKAISTQVLQRSGISTDFSIPFNQTTEQEA